MSYRSIPGRARTAAAALLAAGLTLAGCSNGSGGTADDGKGSHSATAAPSARDAVPSSPRTTADGRTTPPPWDAPADVTARVTAAGLPMLGAEGQAMHIHAHLDVIVDGKPVAVPALIGIDERQQRISPLHTHDPSGVIHIESPVKAAFTLGQFMTEWNVALDGHRLGGLRTGGGKELRAYVNGRQTKGEPAAIVLRAHDEIALVYGAVGSSARIPTGYDWPSGL